ncbi:hypothetical protein [Streptomyces sp. NBC_01431]|uniref:hypothetical protein n=1 Tax=Streptomyces sp. NBC_01431 TaxID=2903863 RepID=UPI002E35E81A|nr:hypothetical protein [Streptomyces sp. NBC_01431]
MQRNLSADRSVAPSGNLAAALGGIAGAAPASRSAPWIGSGRYPVCAVHGLTGPSNSLQSKET